MRCRWASSGGAFLAALALTGEAWGYALLGSKWDTTRPVMQQQMGSSGTLIDGSSSWDAVTEGALATWNSKIQRLQFRVVRNSNAEIADGNGRNNIFFSSTYFGFSFGDAVAITSEWQDGQGRRIEGDSVFNSNLSWNSYRGDLESAESGGTLYDLRRVALHEFGHLLGLDHPDEHGQSVEAIMNSSVSDTDRLMPDDIRGAQALYGARSSAGVRARFTRPTSGQITVGVSAYTFRGTAKPALAKKVYLANSRLGASRRFKAGGLQKWHRKLALRTGRNVIRLFVETPSGNRIKVAQRVVIRRD